MLHVGVLGALEVRRDGRTVAIPGGKTAELLVRLALDPGVVVRAERLIEDLWGDDAVNTQRNTLQSKIARLRRALGEPSAVETVDDGYRLLASADDVDASVVIEAAATAARLHAQGDHRGAIEQCAPAIASFRGDVLAAAPGEWAEPHRARLTTARTSLVETSLGARLALGETAELVGDVEAALAEAPFQEGLWEVLITALYRAGRQADALGAYQRARTALADELGLDPGPRLRTLERQVLEQDPALAGPAPGNRAWADDRRGNLPALAIELVGRANELASLSERATADPLVCVVGPGGIGKTALAIEVGRQVLAAGTVRDGVWLVRLEATSTASEVVDALVAVLGVTGGEAALIDRARSMDALVILDNCEHVVDATAELAVRLLDASPRLHVVATSQVPLGIPGAAVVELEPLTIDDAVDLFTRRSTRRSPDDADRAVTDLCRSLDGLPLAIELAAARTRTLSVAEITRRLDDRFGLLIDPASRLPERRRALRSTIGWSYDLLFPDDQRGLWALSTFAGGASLEAVEYVLAALGVPEAAAMDVVGRLASRSLLIADDAGDGKAVRFRLLDSIRAFAEQAMTEAGLGDTARRAHATWFATAAASSTEGVRSAEQAAHLAFARTERSNIDAALTWAASNDPQLGVQIAIGFGWAWIVLGDSRGAERILGALHAGGEAVSPTDRATGLLLAGWIEASTGALDLAQQHVDRATGLAEQLDDDDLRARSSYHLAYVVSHEGRWEEGLTLTDRSRTLYDRLDRPWDQAANALFALRAATSAGDEHRAVEAREHADHWVGQTADPWLHVRHDAMLGELARLQHRFDDAVTHIGRAAETSARLGFRQTEAYQVSSLGRAQCQAGDHDSGARTLALAVDKAEATGDVRMAALARVHLGRVLRALDRPAEARAALEAADAWHRQAGSGEQVRLGQALLAALDAVEGAPDADERLRSLLTDAREQDDSPVEVFALDALARRAFESGDTEAAEAFTAEADERMVVASHFVTELDRADRRWLRDAAAAVS